MLSFLNILCYMLSHYQRHRSSRPEAFCQKGVLRNFIKFTGKHLRQSLSFNTVTGLRFATLLNNRLWHRCFPGDFIRFPRTPFNIEYLRWLHQKVDTTPNVKQQRTTFSNLYSDWRPLKGLTYPKNPAAFSCKFVEVRMTCQTTLGTKGLS